MRFLFQQIVLTPVHARLRYGSAIFLYLMILILGSIPGARADVGQVASGLVLHGGSYAFLTFLLYTGGSGNAGQRAGKAVLTVMLMGALDELVQSFLPYRHGALGDWLVDTGAALATASVMWMLWRRNKVLA